MTTAVQPRRRAGPFALAAVPPPLRPALRAFLLGYASAVGPRLVGLLARYVKARRSREEVERKEPVGQRLRAALASGFGWDRFPAFCALLIGGSTFLEVSFTVVEFHPKHFALARMDPSSHAIPAADHVCTLDPPPPTAS